MTLPASALAQPQLNEIYGLDFPGRIPDAYVFELRAEAISEYMAAHRVPYPRRGAEPFIDELLALAGGGEIEPLWYGRLVGFYMRGISEDAARRVARHPALGYAYTRALLHMQEPDYPRAALERGLGGHALVELALDERGDVRDTRIIELSDPIFEQPVLQALEHARFLPVVLQGQSIALPRERYRVDFDPEEYFRGEVTGLDSLQRNEGEYIVLLRPLELEHYQATRGIHGHAAAIEALALDLLSLAGGGEILSVWPSLNGFALRGVNEAGAQLIAEHRAVRSVSVSGRVTGSARPPGVTPGAAPAPAAATRSGRSAM